MYGRPYADKNLERQTITHKRTLLKTILPLLRGWSKILKSTEVGGKWFTERGRGHIVSGGVKAVKADTLVHC